MCQTNLFFLITFIILSPNVLAVSNSVKADSFLHLSLRELAQIQVVTSASGFEQKKLNAPASVTIIKAAEWREKGAHNLEQALQGAVSIQLDNVTTGNSYQKYSIRGLSGVFGQQVLLLSDGIPLNRAHHGGTPPLAEIPLHGFKRIEIIRSPGSVVFGADAFAGIINLISYEPGELPNELQLSLGEPEQYILNLSKNYNWDDINFQVALNYHHRGEDSSQLITSDLQTVFDNVFNSSASIAPGVLNDDYHALTFKTEFNWKKFSSQYYLIDSKSGLGGGVAQVLDPTGIDNFKNQNLKFSYDLSEIMQGTFTLSGWYKKQEGISKFTIFPPGTVLPIGKSGNIDFVEPTVFTTFIDGYIGHPANVTKHYHANLIHLFNLNNTQQIRWELGYEKQNYSASEPKNFGPSVLNGTETIVDGALTDVSGTKHIYMPNVSRSFTFASLQNEWQVRENVLLNLGIRIDDYSDFGSTVNPRIGINWAVSKNINIRSFAGSAFRAPSFVDLYAKNNPAAQGNINVKPEEITTYELGLNYQIDDDFHNSFTIFKYQANELIAHITDKQSGIAIAQNIGKNETSGFEWEGRWRPFKTVDVSGNFTYLNSKDGKGKTIPNIAKKLASLTLNWQINSNVNANLTSNWVMDRKRAETDLRNRLKNYDFVNIKLNYTGALKDLELAVVTHNLLESNKAYHPSNGSIPNDFPLPGRQLLFEINYAF